MRKRIIILLGVVSLALLIGVLIPFKRDLSAADMKRITAIVQAETTESILNIHRELGGIVVVSTGVQRGGFDGHGKLFTLKRSIFGWRIVSRGVWMS